MELLRAVAVWYKKESNFGRIVTILFSDDSVQTYTLNPAFLEMLAETLASEEWAAIQRAIQLPETEITVKRRTFNGPVTGLDDRAGCEDYSI